MIRHLTFVLAISFLAFSCSSGRIENVRLDGRLVARQVVEFKYDLPNGL